MVEMTAGGYNISSGVGRGQANIQDDVMLLQVMLFGARSPKWPQLSLAQAGLAPDGAYGPQTQAWIDAFQIYGMLDYGTVNDGVMDHVPTDTGSFSFPTDGSGISHMYSVTALNIELGGNNLTLFNSMAINGNVPARLRSALQGAAFVGAAGDLAVGQDPGAAAAAGGVVGTSF